MLPPSSRSMVVPSVMSPSPIASGPQQPHHIENQLQILVRNGGGVLGAPAQHAIDKAWIGNHALHFAADLAKCRSGTLGQCALEVREVAARELRNHRLHR